MGGPFMFERCSICPRQSKYFECGWIDQFKGVFGIAPAPSSSTRASGAAPNARALQIGEGGALRPIALKHGATHWVIHETVKCGATGNYR
jgi:hypothetical protein